MSEAVPVIVTGFVAVTDDPAPGYVIAADGATVSVDADAETRGGTSVAGCTPMSASRFTVACCMEGSGDPPATSWLPSSPQDHWAVPAEKTLAPLECL